MSRYEIQPRPQVSPEIVIAVGWDNPLGTFFAQVEQKPPGDDSDADPTSLLWLGTRYGQVQELEEVITALAPWADVPQELRAQLLEDQANHINWQEGPIQRVLRLMSQQP